MNVNRYLALKKWLINWLGFSLYFTCKLQGKPTLWLNEPEWSESEISTETLVNHLGYIDCGVVCRQKVTRILYKILNASIWWSFRWIIVTTMSRQMKCTFIDAFVDLTHSRSIRWHLIDREWSFYVKLYSKLNQQSPNHSTHIVDSFSPTYLNLNHSSPTIILLQSFPINWFNKIHFILELKRWKKRETNFQWNSMVFNINFCQLNLLTINLHFLLFNRTHQTLPV